MNILHEDCESDIAKDKSLPLDSFLVSYLKDDRVCYDVVRSGTQVEVFDYYYDKSYQLKSIEWTKGIVSPKTYDYTPKENKKRKR